MVQVDPFIGGVGLGDVTGAVKDGGGAGGCDGGGVGKEIDPDGLSSPCGPGELLDKWQGGICLEGVAWDASQVEEIGLELVGSQGGKDFPAGGFFRLPGDGAAVDIDGAGIGDDVWLGAAPDDTDVDGGTAEQGMPGLFQAGCVVREEHVHDPCHAVNGAGAEVWCGTVGGPAGHAELPPEIALVRGDNLQSCWFADDGEVGRWSFFCIGPGTALQVFLINQADEDDLGVLWALLLPGELAEGMKVGGDTALGVAGSTAMEPPIPDTWLELGVIRRDNIHVGCQQDALPDLSPGLQADQQVPPAGQDGLPGNVETMLFGDVDEVIGNGFLGGGVCIIWKE